MSRNTCDLKFGWRTLIFDPISESPGEGGPSSVEPGAAGESGWVTAFRGGSIEGVAPLGEVSASPSSSSTAPSCVLMV